MINTLVINFGDTSVLHPDEAEIIDCSITGVGTGKNEKHLNYIGMRGTMHVYEFGPKTTPEYINKVVGGIKRKFPELEIIYELI